MIWIYALLSVIFVSLISLIGIFTFRLNEHVLKKMLIYFVGFSTGGLLGGAFFHLIPEVAETGFSVEIALYILSGIIVFFVVEKFIHWRHCHVPTSNIHPHSFAYMNLVGDSVHNFIDGMIIAGSYLISIPLGISTTIAVIIHEIPQEIGDYGVLIYGGFKKTEAIAFNFLTALTAIVGAVVALSLSGYFSASFPIFLASFAAGGFIYIGGSDLIPELHKETKASKSAAQLVSILLGIILMLVLLSL